MKKQQTTKYKKQKKKELANRKAKQLAVQLDDDRLGEFVPGAIEKIMEAVKPDTVQISPARRAFQDI